jgi:D-lactate dehydrogenase (cytochrome)
MDLAASPSAVARVAADLTARFGPRAVASMAVRSQHAQGEGLHNSGLPDLVVYPETAEEIAAILTACDAARVPVVPYGAGTSLEGQLAAVRGGVSIDTSRMDKVLEVNPDSMDCRVQAGVTREALNAYIRDTGLFFPVDPGANATLGGMASTRASGTNAVRYGTMRDNTLGLTVVTPDGNVVRTGSRARKSSTGLDLTQLYVGSEGTLGVITEVQVKLHPIPESVVAAVVQFPDLESAVGAVVAALQSGIQPGRVELLDEAQMRCCIAYSKLSYAAAPTLFLEFVGNPRSTAEDVANMRDIAADFGGGDFQFAERAEDRAALWKARHMGYFALLAAYPGKRPMGTDACVPISALPACLLETKADIEASGMEAPIVGHVGDGNFHVGIIYDPAIPEEIERAEALAFRISRRAIAMGGSCSGEHGVGLHKIVHMEAQHGYGTRLMLAIKAALDPNGIMNPGKVYAQA